MYLFTIPVSIRKGSGPEWYQKIFTVEYTDLDFDITIEDLKEWAKEDVRSQLRAAMKDSQDEENWVIENVELKKV
ncbi:hypothetical protein [Aquimarina muelleri]|uniref:Uncharacterized protein n=1 Tax=Aquimarina muelleri TaxID=279356 RepID=A0A918JZ05_9FLAO|nr:hypothetical protein [Aquimarina muelleri]MCX2761849.1 hypothetical protein [Aquimarina muelleri]GGX23691.1 hypothetical protein GCM10007384_26140 [Aquimarina muelleri]